MAICTVKLLLIHNEQEANYPLGFSPLINNQIYSFLQGDHHLENIPIVTGIILFQLDQDFYGYLQPHWYMSVKKRRKRKNQSPRTANINCISRFCDRSRYLVVMVLNISCFQNNQKILVNLNCHFSQGRHEWDLFLHLQQHLPLWELPARSAISVIYKASGHK